jgi:glutathione S-transferase
VRDLLTHALLALVAVLVHREEKRLIERMNCRVKPGMSAGNADASVQWIERTAINPRDQLRLVMAKLRIYGVARTRAFRVLWIANELGLDYEHVPIEIGPGGARKAEYLAINPNGRVPAIADDGFILWESLAITLYLAKKHGRLCPTTLEGEAKAWQWSLWAVQEVDRGVNIWSLHAVRLPVEDRDPQRRAEALKVLEGPFKVLDEALAGGPYLLGEDFTVADLNVAAVISRAIDMDLAATPRLAAWLKRCLERPAARAACALRAKADAETSAEVVRAIARHNRL